MDILLVEADYKNKYPPLGLMKISAYHKGRGDNVIFVKGKNKELKSKTWDRIYITTLFTFYWKKTIDTIKFYYNSTNNPEHVFVGGILATLLETDLRNETGLEGITIQTGLLNRPRMISDENTAIDRITPDYNIIDTTLNKYLDYEYEIKNSYITSTTKGCVRKCAFCAVSTLEPEYCEYIDIRGQIEEVNKLFGEKRNLMLMDNNILASPQLEKIVDDLVGLGFGAGNKSYAKRLGNKLVHQQRYVDFNQGTDARLLTDEKMHQIARLELKPLRVAFDHADEENVRIYVDAQRRAARYGVKNLSNYILFNFHDTPKELYKRLRINIELNNEFERAGFSTRIWSFPMKYMPFAGEHSKDRKYIGEHWNAKMLRGVQCVLNATHAVVGPKEAFFNHAFGENYDEFIMLIYMPELYITKRKANEININLWKERYQSLSEDEHNEFISLIKENRFPLVNVKNNNVRQLYECYCVKGLGKS